MAGRAAEGLLPGSLATGRPPAWGLNSVSAVGSQTIDSLVSSAHWNRGEFPIGAGGKGGSLLEQGDTGGSLVEHRIYACML